MKIKMLVLTLLILAMGCAKPVLHVSKAEMPRINKIFVAEGETYKRFESPRESGSKEEIIFIDKIPNGELEKVFRETLKEELGKVGLRVESIGGDDVLAIKFRIAETPATIISNGFVGIHWMIYYQDILLIEESGAVLTSIIAPGVKVLRWKNGVPSSFAKQIAGALLAPVSSSP